MTYETAEQRKKRLEREKNQRTTSSRWSSSTPNYSNLPNPYDPAYYDYSTPSSGSDCDTSSSDSSSSSCDTSTSSDY